MRLNKTNCLEPGTAMRHRSILRAVMPVLLCLLSFGISVQAASVTAGGITAMFPDSYTVLTSRQSGAACRLSEAGQQNAGAAAPGI